MFSIQQYTQNRKKLERFKTSPLMREQYQRQFANFQLPNQQAKKKKLGRKFVNMNLLAFTKRTYTHHKSWAVKIYYSTLNKKSERKHSHMIRTKQTKHGKTWRRRRQNMLHNSSGAFVRLEGEGRRNVYKTSFQLLFIRSKGEQFSKKNLNVQNLFFQRTIWY